MADRKSPYSLAFKEIGKLYSAERARLDRVQEDVIDYGFSVRHYQQLEAGRPHSLTTLFRVAEMYGVPPSKFLQGLNLPKFTTGKKRTSKR